MSGDESNFQRFQRVGKGVRVVAPAPTTTGESDLARFQRQMDEAAADVPAGPMTVVSGALKPRTKRFQPQARLNEIIARREKVKALEAEWDAKAAAAQATTSGWKRMEEYLHSAFLVALVFLVLWIGLRGWWEDYSPALLRLLSGVLR